MKRQSWVVLIAVTGYLHGAPASGDPLAGSERFGPAYNPPVPVSILAAPLAWFDPSRLQVSSSFSFGSGFGQGSNALQVTSFSYQFGAPLEIGVRLGNTFGTGFSRQSSSFFLEGLDVSYRPTPNLTFEIHTRDYRSPLQYGSRPGLLNP